jgi:hypothetical protein
MKCSGNRTITLPSNRGADAGAGESPQPSSRKAVGIDGLSCLCVTFASRQSNQILHARNVTLLSAGLDEVPMACKGIETVMAARRDLVEPVARFEPRLVRMAPGGEPPEDSCCGAGCGMRTPSTPVEL